VKLTVGRIVHVPAADRRCLPALVLGREADRAIARSFDWMTTRGPSYETTLFRDLSVWLDDAGEGQSWHDPRRCPVELAHHAQVRAEQRAATQAARRR